MSGGAEITISVTLRADTISEWTPERMTSFVAGVAEAMKAGLRTEPATVEVVRFGADEPSDAAEEPDARVEPADNHAPEPAKAAKPGPAPAGTHSRQALLKPTARGRFLRDAVRGFSDAELAGKYGITAKQARDQVRRYRRQVHDLRAELIAAGEEPPERRRTKPPPGWKPPEIMAAPAPDDTAFPPTRSKPSWEGTPEADKTPLATALEFLVRDDETLQIREASRGLYRVSCQKRWLSETEVIALANERRAKKGLGPIGAKLPEDARC